MLRMIQVISYLACVIEFHQSLKSDRYLCLREASPVLATQMSTFDSNDNKSIKV